MLQVGRHRLVNLFGMFRLLLRSKLCLRQNEIDCGGLLPCYLADTVPIGRLGGKLVAGNDRPFLHVIHLRNQNICG